jgi:ABC-type xylose transport system substrate-binding protein
MVSPACSSHLVVIQPSLCRAPRLPQTSQVSKDSTSAASTSAEMASSLLFV